MILDDELIKKIKGIKNIQKQSELASFLTNDTPVDVLLKKANYLISKKEFKSFSIITIIFPFM